MTRAAVRSHLADVESILISEVRLRRRVRELSRELERDFAGGELVVVSLLNGTVLFLADLVRGLDLPLRLDFIGVSSYGNGTEARELVYERTPAGRSRTGCAARGRYSDTGRTLRAVTAKVEQLKLARSRLACCC
jgi:hypoxanthine phosphoribosyltransferase